MLASWVTEELRDLNLCDQRLNDRMGQILGQLGSRPSASIPSACGGWAETMAAYRFFDNPKVSFENLLEPHIDATYRRIQDQSVVILVQDTTEINLTRPTREVMGAGPLDCAARRGAFLHPLLGFTPDGTPLGMIYAEAWMREDDPAPQRKKEYERKHTPIEEKESIRWVDAFQEVKTLADHATHTHLVCVADSEADIYEVFESAETIQADWIVRACQNRALKSTPEKTAEATQHLRQRVLNEPCLFTNDIHVRSRQSKLPNDKRKRKQSRQSRDTQVQVRAATVTLRGPWRYDRKLKDISINVVLATEVNPPKGEEPVEWMLLTSLPIETEDQVRQIIEYYAVRWMIEVYFRTLKSSCRIEERQFEHIERALNCVAIYMIVAWRALMICRISRHHPDISCEAIFEPEEWKSVYYVIYQQPPPDDPPTLQQMTRMVGVLGGYLDRVRDDQPGPQTVSLGLQRAHDIATCWKLFGPESRRNKICV